MSELKATHKTIRIPDELLERLEKIQARMEKKASVKLNQSQVMLRMLENGCTGYEKMMEREERKR